MITALQKL